MEKAIEIIKPQLLDVNMTYKQPLCPECLRKGIEIETKYYFPPFSNKRQLNPIAMLCEHCENKQKSIWEQKELEKTQEFIKRNREKIMPFSDIGSKYKNSSFDKFNTSVEGLNDCHIWAKRFTDRIINGGKKFSFYLYGTTGCGKTELQSCSYNEQDKHGKNCLFTTLGKLFECMHDYDNVRVLEVYKMIKGLDSLLIDDFAATPLDRKSRGWLFEIFDICDKHEIPMFISSNINKADDVRAWISGESITALEAVRTKRVLSRIIRNFKRLENKAADYSYIKAKEIEDGITND